VAGAKEELPGEAKNATKRSAARLIFNLSMMVRVLYFTRPVVVCISIL
jgi:hypothetical protein